MDNNKFLISMSYRSHIIYECPKRKKRQISNLRQLSGESSQNSENM